MTFPRWQPGRQGGGYEKLTVFAGRPWLPVDLHLIRYRVGQGVAVHLDPVDGRVHWRLNVVLRAARRGGEFRGGGRAEHFPIDWNRVLLFRPDEVSHGVDVVEEGERLVLSVGWAMRGRP